MAEQDLTTESAQLIAQVNEEMRLYGKLTRETQAALAAGSESAAKSLTAWGTVSSNALAGFTAGIANTTKIIAQGQQGMKAFDGMIDALGGAAKSAGNDLWLMGGPVSKVASVVLKFAALLTGPAKAINEMIDVYYDSYKKLSQAGAVGSDGMMGVGNDALKMGIVLKDMDQYVQMITAAAPNLALLGGNVVEGRRQLADMGVEAEADRVKFFTLGMNMQDVNEGMLGFIKQQHLSGQVLTRDSKKLYQAAQKYILETDILTKITGVSRQTQEEQNAAAMREEQYNALIRKVELEQGTPAADAIRTTRKMLENLTSPEIAKGFASALTGNLSDPVAQKYMLTAGADSVAFARGLIDGSRRPVEVVGKVTSNLKRVEGALSRYLALVGANNKSFVDYSGIVKGAMVADKMDEIEQAEADAIKQQADAEKNTDAATVAQAKIRDTQLQTSVTAQRTLQAGIDPLQKAGLALTDIVLSLTQGLGQLVTWFFKKPAPSAPPPSVVDAKEKSRESMIKAEELSLAIERGDKTEKTKLELKKAESEYAMDGAQLRASELREKRLIRRKMSEGLSREEATKAVQKSQAAQPVGSATAAETPAATAPAATGGTTTPAEPTSPPAAPAKPQAAPPVAAVTPAGSSGQTSGAPARSPTIDITLNSNAQTPPRAPSMPDSGSILPQAKSGVTNGPAVVGKADAVIPLQSGKIPVDLGSIGVMLQQLKPQISPAVISPASNNEQLSTHVRTTLDRLAQDLSQPKPAQVEMLELLKSIRRSNQETADISDKIARSAMN